MLHQPIYRTFSSTHFHNPTLPLPPNRQQKTPKRGKTLTYDTRETLTYGTRETLTYGIGKTLTPFEVASGAENRLNFDSKYFEDIRKR